MGINEDWIKKFGFIGSVNEKVEKADFGLMKLMNNLFELRGVNDEYKEHCSFSFTRILTSCVLF